MRLHDGEEEVVGLRRVEAYNPALGKAHMEVCAELDCRDAELLAFANAEYPAADGWVRVVRDFDHCLRPMACSYDRRRMHYVLVKEGG